MVAVLGVYHLALGLLIALAPREFYEQIAGFPPYNGHFLRDVATFYVALGVATLMAVRRPAWRVPVLALTLLQYALHVLNHLVDVGDTDPGWHGPSNVVSLAVVLIVAAWLYRRERA